MDKLHFKLEAEDKTCFVTHASRSDIILGLISHSQQQMEKGVPFSAGLLLTGLRRSNFDGPRASILHYISNSNIPIIYTAVSTINTMKAIL